LTKLCPSDPFQVDLVWPRSTETGPGPSVEAYKAEIKREGAAEWLTANSSGGPLLGFASEPSHRSREVQILTIRVDRDQPPISSGTFQLVLNFAQISEFDRPMADIVTRPIAFDASAADLKAALEELENVQRVQVRCGGG
jgi:hypothetical protein